MALISDLPLKHRVFLFGYRYRRVDPFPWTPLKKPLAECRVALATTAAFYLPGQEPFDEELRGGDTSSRIVPARTESGEMAPELDTLEIGHRSDAFDHAGIEANFELALPVSTFLSLERERRIGSLHGEAASFMGSITAPRRLQTQSAPEVAETFVSAGVDVVFLTPV